MDAAEVADLAEQYLRQHSERTQAIERLYARLRRVDEAIGAWDERAAWDELPEDVKAVTRKPREPIIQRTELVSLRRTILTTLERYGER